MSLWHPPHSFESMKKSDGIRPPVLVRADDGQNGDLGPSPSSVMDMGTISGLRMRSFGRSEEHTSELQSHLNLVCRLLLEKKNKNNLQVYAEEALSFSKTVCI